MSARVTSGPEDMPVTIEEARIAARINGTDSDGEIKAHVDGLTKQAEHIIGQVIINRTYLVKLPSFPSVIAAPMLPAGEVLSVVYFDVDGAEQTLSTNAYRLDDTLDVPSIVLNDGFEWPETATRTDAVKITMICGYGADSTSTPAEFKAYILAKTREHFAPAGTPESPHLIRMLDSLKEYA